MLKLICLFLAVLFGFANICILLYEMTGRKTKGISPMNALLMSAGITGFIYLQWLSL